MARPVSRRGTGLQVVRAPDRLREAVATLRREGHTVGFVPTMGALHQGHLSLVEQAKRVGDAVVVSIFVNPTQFDDPSDLAAYPRREDEDLAKLQAAGVAVVFAPSVGTVYPPRFSTAVEVRGIGERFEGALRGRGHFQGVATVVLKLLNMVQPDRLYLGQKDAQQAALLKRMVRDLDLPLSVVVCPTVRDADGVALSSRNERLTPEERLKARALPAALEAAAAAVRAGRRESQSVVAVVKERLRAAGVEPEYVAVVEEECFTPLSDLGRGGLLIVAARLGKTRLIDNLRFEPTAVAAAAPIEEILCNA